MFRKLLVANRGEIAVRVMRACEELGVETVAIYSEADSDSGHVRYADEAYNVGPARAAESYLDHEAVLEVAEKADADAIHPGYGFLAENAEFAEKVEATDGITWVGPSSDAMETLGEKTKARTVMEAADVPIVPGTTEPVTDPEDVREFGEEHGYPVAIKAEGGGGGRGMKVVESDDEVDGQLESARREGEAYFGNDSVYLERYLESPRHIEVQILADEHGNVRHLGERDCSLQRRHQKVLEEGPSPALDDELRAQIGEAARRGVAEAEYVNAGTVEFLVEEEPNRDGPLGPDANFYFLEVNTRIQVEHPVTEEITGIDIVKCQIRVAAGEELDFEQEAVEIDGHAMEFRVNAEDAAAEFQPAPGGKLVTYDPPGGFGVRMDDALRQGDAIVTDYDSMIAKLIVRGSDREECIARSIRAIDEYDLEGVTTILPFHRLMLTDETFVAGKHTTTYLDEDLDGDRIVEAYERWGDGETVQPDDEDVVEREFTVEVNGKRFEVNLADRSGALAVTPNGGSSGSGRPESAGPSGDSASGSEGDGVSVDGGEVVDAEMQGTILSIEVEEGQDVTAGDTLVVLEAMKMENDIVAARGGTVESVAVGEGDSVDMGDTLVVLE